MLVKQAGTQRDLVRKAREIAENNGMPPISATIMFNSHHKEYTRKEITEKAEKLFNLVNVNIEEIIKKGGYPIRIKPNKENKDIVQIVANWNTIDGKKWLEAHHWITNEPGFVSINFISEIQIF